MHDRAALVHIARDGNTSDEGLRGDEMKGRCTMICKL